MATSTAAQAVRSGTQQRGGSSATRGEPDRSRGGRRQHVEVDAGHVCGVCGEAFETERGLTLHRNVNHGG